jgi:hypothetical protein
MPDLVTDGDDLGNHVATKALLHVKALDVASADAITLTDRGNTFDITGTTTINHINTTNWGVGGMVILQFDGAVTLTHNAGSLAGSEGNMLLARNQNYTTTAGDILTFVLHDSTNWKEISRSNIITSVSTDTLTNKTISGSTNTLSDITKSSITGSPTGDFVGTSDTQTLSNKTLTSVDRVVYSINTTNTNLDFSSNDLQTISITSDTTFTGSNYSSGSSKTVKITTDGTDRNLTFPVNWKFVGTKPTSQVASKTGILTMTCFGTSESDVVCAYAVEE